MGSWLGLPICGRPGTGVHPALWSRMMPLLNGLSCLDMTHVQSLCGGIVQIALVSRAQSMLASAETSQHGHAMPNDTVFECLVLCRRHPEEPQGRHRIGPVCSASHQAQLRLGRVHASRLAFAHPSCTISTVRLLLDYHIRLCPGKSWQAMASAHLLIGAAHAYKDSRCTCYVQATMWMKIVYTKTPRRPGGRCFRMRTAVDCP